MNVVNGVDIDQLPVRVGEDGKPSYPTLGRMLEQDEEIRALWRQAGAERLALRLIEADKAGALQARAGELEEKLSRARAELDALRAEAVQREALRAERERFEEEREAVRAQARAARQQLHAERRRAAIEAALREGRIYPRNREYWEGQFDKDPAGTERILAELPRNPLFGVLGSGADPGEETVSPAAFEIFRRAHPELSESEARAAFRKAARG